MTNDLYKMRVSVRWADLDPNFHLRHSVYYDFGAQQRIDILTAMGLTPEVMTQGHFGPVIFREECVFRREIRLGDEVYLTAKFVKQTPDASRWTIQHEFISANNKTLAVLTIDGAWMDTQLRKLLSPIPEIIIRVFNDFPKVES